MIYNVEKKYTKNHDFFSEIKKLKKEKNAIILGHYYQTPEVQDISDFIGDSLALSQMAEKTDADIIVFAGVTFMAETAKILNPTKKVLIPDMEAGCSLSDSCPVDKFSEFIKNYPNHTVVTYVNSSTEVKALSDIICTSSNAVKIVNSLPKDEKIVFAPDKNLGSYIEKLTNRKMVLWDGACHVHKQFSLSKILKLKAQNIDAQIIAHPECQSEILILADFIGSTNALLDYSTKSNCKKFIVVTESGILYKMRSQNSNKLFIPAPPDDSVCACNDCNFMKLITLEKIYLSLKYEQPEVKVDEHLRELALKPIKKMLSFT